jgi:uncharacterized membrane protein
MLFRAVPFSLFLVSNINIKTPHRSIKFLSINGLVVMIAAFQAAERGSIPR